MMSSKSGSEKTLWDIAYEEKLKIETSYREPGKEDMQDEPRNSCIFVCGSRQCGKTSMIFRFLERDENPKPTVSLDYSFGRKSRGHKMIKDVCHIYELGAGTNMCQLMKVIDPLIWNFEAFSIILVLDLSKPNEMWSTQDVLIKEMKSVIAKAFDELERTARSTVTRLKQRFWEQIGENHVDKNLMDPFFLPFLIIGAKYDKYQELEPEKKKIISKTLRFIAHKYGASLQFTSNEIASLSNKTRSLFSSMGFNTTTGKSSSFDHNKPVIVHAGQDKFEDIGAPPVSSERMIRSKAGSPTELWKEAFVEIFPQENVDKFELKNDPSKDRQYAEPFIDAIKSQKDQELENLKKLSERKAKEADISKNQTGKLRSKPKTGAK